jgi:hypothetical protein
VGQCFNSLRNDIETVSFGPERDAIEQGAAPTRVRPELARSVDRNGHYCVAAVWRVQCQRRNTWRGSCGDPQLWVALAAPPAAPPRCNCLWSWMKSLRGGDRQSDVSPTGLAVCTMPAQHAKPPSQRPIQSTELAIISRRVSHQHRRATRYALLWAQCARYSASPRGRTRWKSPTWSFRSLRS